MLLFRNRSDDDAELISIFPAPLAAAPCCPNPKPVLPDAPGLLASADIDQRVSAKP